MFTVANSYIDSYLRRKWVKNKPGEMKGHFEDLGTEGRKIQQSVKINRILRIWLDSCGLGQGNAQGCLLRKWCTEYYGVGKFLTCRATKCFSQWAHLKSNERGHCLITWCNAGFAPLSKNVWPTSVLWLPARWNKASSTSKTHSSGESFEPPCYLALCARCVCTGYNILVRYVPKKKIAIIMLKISGVIE